VLGPCAPRCEHSCTSLANYRVPRPLPHHSHHPHLYHLNREINNALRSQTLPCLHRPAEIPEHVFWLGREK
jgi:hypothetical protein